MKMQCVLQPALSVSIEGTRQQVQDALATKEEVLIQQRQSQELVQIMLNASVRSFSIPYLLLETNHLA